MGGSPPNTPPDSPPPQGVVIHVGRNNPGQFTYIPYNLGNVPQPWTVASFRAHYPVQAGSRILRWTRAENVELGNHIVLQAGDYILIS